MALKCPKCQTYNPSNFKFREKCTIPLLTLEEISVSHTKTLQTPKKEITWGTTFAGKYEIIRYLNPSFRAERPFPYHNHKFFIIQKSM